MQRLAFAPTRLFARTAAPRFSPLLAGGLAPALVWGGRRGSPPPRPASSAAPAPRPRPAAETAPALKKVVPQESWRDAVLYFVIVDRFADGDGNNNQNVD